MRISIFPALGVMSRTFFPNCGHQVEHRYTPGVGVGGHCIPVDPYYMIQRAANVGVPANLITAARGVNGSMPIHVAGVIRDLAFEAKAERGS